jgi:predicted phosphodiesterase
MAWTSDARVDFVVVGGDVLPGPMPRETLACLMTLEMPVRFIHGNGDRVVDAHLAGGDISEIPEVFREVIHWTAQQLDATRRQAIPQWPPTYELDIAGVGHALFCHATPRNDTECFTRATAEDRLTPLFGTVNASGVVCGHTHMQFDRTIAGRRVINAGSVGMPFAAPRGAYWLLLGPGVQLRRTDYDFETAADHIRATAPTGGGARCALHCQPADRGRIAQDVRRLRAKLSTDRADSQMATFVLNVRHARL